MPVPTSYDVLNHPPRPVSMRFELAARRLAETWLLEGRVRATAEDLTLAAEFLARCGLTAEPLPGLEVRLTSEKGRETITTREGAIVTALRCLAALDAQHATSQLVAHAA
jgi:hypothetical protein